MSGGARAFETEVESLEGTSEEAAALPPGVACTVQVVALVAEGGGGAGAGVGGAAPVAASIRCDIQRVIRWKMDM